MTLVLWELLPMTLVLWELFKSELTYSLTYLSERVDCKLAVTRKYTSSWMPATGRTRIDPQVRWVKIRKFQTMLSRCRVNGLRLSMNSVSLNVIVCMYRRDVCPCAVHYMSLCLYVSIRLQASCSVSSVRYSTWSAYLTRHPSIAWNALYGLRRINDRNQ